MNLLLLILFAFPAYGQLYRLNAFPEKNHFSSIGLGYEDAEIEADTLNFASYAKNDKNLIAKAIYGRKVNKKTYFYISLPYIYSEESSLRYGDNTGDTFTSQGFREPTLGIARRLRNKEDSGQYFTDIFFSYIPKIFEKEVGGHDANKFNGKHVLTGKLTTGALYDKYESIIGVQATFNSEAREDNLKSNEDYVFESYFSSRAYISAQMEYRDDLFFFITSGITFVEDYDVEGVNGESTIQQGTGTFAELGLKKLLKSGFINLRLSYTSNDYFTESRDLGNFRGEYYMLGAQTSYTFEF
tara:strand:+ start:109614 stop:110510 length:897 start_codon:yes stop_codon:yes gene_type:complete